MDHSDLVAPANPSIDTDADRAFRLNRDILWLIFNINGDAFTSSTALETTLFSSQVCKEWRSVILNTPALWGNLIDLDVLDQKGDNWRDEVLRRSGNSALSITSFEALDLRRSSEEKLKPWKKFFCSILSKHWSRVERLRVNMDVRLIEPSLWQALCCQAPRLRVFQLTTFERTSESDIMIMFDRPIFANDAPLLESFCAPLITLTSSAPWLSTLHALHLEPPFSQLFRILKMTPRLETLSYHRGANNHAAEGSVETDLYLPYLQHMEIESGLTNCANLLRCIVDAGSAGFRSFDATLYDKTSDNRESVAKSLEVLRRITQAHFCIHNPTSIELGLHPTKFDLNTTTSIGPLFSLSISLRNSEWVLSAMSAFKLPSFNIITELELRISSEWTSLVRCTPVFVLFLSSFSSLKTLCLDEKAISTLLALLEEASEPLFPLLEVVKLRPEPGQLDQDGIYNFLSQRRVDSRPTLILDLTERVGFSRVPDFLEDMEGLKILWYKPGIKGIVEHICGSRNMQTVRTSNSLA